MLSWALQPAYLTIARESVGLEVTGQVERVAIMVARFALDIVDIGSDPAFIVVARAEVGEDKVGQRHGLGECRHGGGRATIAAAVSALYISVLYLGTVVNYPPCLTFQFMENRYQEPQLRQEV